MATKKKAVPEEEAEEAAPEAAPEAEPEFEPSDAGVGPDDPSYQAPAVASEEELAVLDEGPEARRDAVNADIEKMHGG